MPVVVVEPVAEKGIPSRAARGSETRPTSEGSEGHGKLMEKSGHKARLTTADLVLLSLLTERSMHGYQANAELERREIRDWAEISRPQVYYSLEKLHRMGMLREAQSGDAAAGPHRRTYEVTAAGRKALRVALEREEWATGRDKPVFLTWLALSWQAQPAMVREQLRRREEFLRRELHREKETLASVLREVGHAHHEAVWMIRLMIEHFEVELRWLEKVAREMSRRGRAKHPEYAEG